MGAVSIFLGLCQPSLPFASLLIANTSTKLGMRFLDLNRYSLISFVATLVAIAYSSHKSLFHTPSSLLNLSFLKSLEPLLKDVIPPHPSLDSVLSDFLRKDHDISSGHIAHSRLLSGAAGIDNGFRPSVFQAMLAERYLKFRTPSPAVLMQLQIILSYLQNEKLCVLVRSSGSSLSS
jgi:hypothetical protein